MALIAGLAAGSLLAARAPSRVPDMLMIAQPMGQLWLDALTMTIVPLIFGLLVGGIARAAESARGGGIAGRAILWFAILLTGACLAAAMMTSAALDLFPIPAEAAKLRAAGMVPDLAQPADCLAGLIPTNPVKAAAEGTMVPLVIFALFFGFAVARIDDGLRASILTVIQALVETMLVIVRWVLLVAPLGVGALALGVGARIGLSAAGALLHYMAIVAGVCLLATLLAYATAILIGRVSLPVFQRAALPAQLVAVSTQSSLATLPAMVGSTAALGVSASSAAVILPLAVTLFRAASAAANVSVALYLAHLHGIPLPPAAILLGALVAVPVSLAAVGLPAQVSFVATIGPVCLAMGVPLSLLPLLLAVESIPDIFRTLGNVSADLAVLRLAGVRGDDPGDAADDQGRRAPAFDSGVVAGSGAGTGGGQRGWTA